MGSPLPKPAGARQRRNKVAGARTLSVVTSPKRAPRLPDKESGWHSMTKAWWADVWASPMAPEFDASDRHGLFLLAVLVDDFWVAPRAEKAAEIRLQRQCFGLTPIDRRRLQWEIDRGDQAERSTRRRRNEEAPKATDHAEDDPRLLLA